MIHRGGAGRLAAALLVAVASAPGSWATWSIVITDTRTGDVAIGQATCVQNIDLQALTPGLVTGTGAGTVAGFVDVSGQARTIIRDAFLAETPAYEILQVLAFYEDFEQHQYSIADVNGFAVTYTGTITQANGNWFGGQAGRDGDIAYAVSGNLLTGAPVIDEAVAAILVT
ncbi:MAG: DUF1028 domain-containing protein, partial [Acidobacteriota bacterium]|nr:DUF1028 domain-containing protein [Acidobacteriota bacterium]